MKNLVLDKKFKQATKDLESFVSRAQKKLFVFQTLTSRQEISNGQALRFSNSRSLLAKLAK